MKSKVYAFVIIIYSRTR